MMRGNYTENINDFSRCRSLPLETIIKLLLCWDGAPIDRYLYDCGLGEVSPSAFVQQRAKIRPQAFYALLKRLNIATAGAAAQHTELFKGYYNLYAVDGTSLAIPRTVAKKNPEYLVVSKTNPDGVCLVHYNTLYNLSERRFIDCVEGADEQGKLFAMLYRNRFTPRDVLLLDRGYFALNAVCHLLRSPAHFLLRAREGQTMKAVSRLIDEHPDGLFDEMVSVEVTTHQTNENKQNPNCVIIQSSKRNRPKSGRARWVFETIADPYPLTYRCVRVQLDNGAFETLITDLPSKGADPVHGLDADGLKQLYFQRWQLEVAYKMAKYPNALINIHSRKIESIHQEAFSALIIYNITQLIANSVVKENKNTELQYKVDMTMASKLTREFIRNPYGDGNALIQTMARYQMPVRPNRQRSPRNIRAKGVVPFNYRIASG